MDAATCANMLDACGAEQVDKYQVRRHVASYGQARPDKVPKAKELMDYEDLEKGAGKHNKAAGSSSDTFEIWVVCSGQIGVTGTSCHVSGPPATEISFSWHRSVRNCLAGDGQSGSQKSATAGVPDEALNLLDVMCSPVL